MTNYEEQQQPESTRAARGFAAMSPERKREIASKGGRAAHMKGTAHEFTSDEARAAGRKGGETVSRDRQHMAEIGRKGGIASRAGNGDNGNESRTQTKGANRRGSKS